LIIGVKRPMTNYSLFVDLFTGLKTLSDGKTYNYSNRVCWENDEIGVEIYEGKLKFYINEESLGLAFESLILREGGLKLFVKLMGSQERLGIMQGFTE